MTADRDKLTLASRDDLANALAFALRFEGRKRVHNADEIMAQIVAKRLVDHLERSGFVVMKRPPIGGGAALAEGMRADDDGRPGLRGGCASHVLPKRHSGKRPNRHYSLSN